MRHCPRQSAALSRSAQRPIRASARWWVAGSLVALAGILWAASRHDASVPVALSDDRWRPAPGRFAGTAACGECHADLVRQQQASAHARTLRSLGQGRAPRAPLSGQPVLDPLTSAEYRVVADQGQAVLQLRSGGLPAQAGLNWEFGSGQHAHGYLIFLPDQTVVDCRLNWYRSIDGWDFASGQDKPLRGLVTQPLGRVLPPAEVARCFSCHSTELLAQGATRAGVPGERLRLNLERTVVGVSCERCHGPRADHVERSRRGVPPSPRARLTAAEVNRLCGECHSRTDLTSSHEVIARFQPWGLERSECYRQSQGRLSCLTCHDPHGDASQEPGFYDQRCRSCHSAAPAPTGVAARVCPVNPRSGCAGCHMARDSKAMLHVTFTDHQIRILSRAGRGVDRKDPGK